MPDANPTTSRRDNAQEKARKQAYYQANRERTQEEKTARRSGNLEKHRARERAYCEANRDAIRKRARAYYAANKAQILSLQKRRKYGLDRTGFNALMKLQRHRCAICKTAFGPNIPRIDHCHSTGKVRGLLCIPCNSGLARFRDDPAILRRAASYLTKREHSTG
jgi:hypothetical protein